MAYALQPLAIAPVLPGETLTNLYLESRVITDSIRNSRIGWKKEYFAFYVRITDLLVDDLVEMFIDPTNTDLASTYGIAANDQAFYTAKGGIDYNARCIKKIWADYFADEGDVYTDYDISGVHASVNGLAFTQLKDFYWLDSITDEDNMPAGADPGTATTMDQLERLDALFQQLRALGIADMTYEDWLRSYGVIIPNKDENKAELLAHFSDFQYPSNTVEPSTGVPASAVSWVFKNGNRERKAFKEPGFVVLCSVTRPKAYYAGLAGSLAAHMTRAWDWVPNYLNEAAETPMPYTSLKKFTTDTGPLGDRTTATDGYWIDMRDVFLKGDQYQNVAAFNAVPANDGANHLLALPPGDNHHLYKYPDATMAKSFFTDFAGTAFYIKEDGYVSLTISGKQVDYTVGNIAQL